MKKQFLLLLMVVLSLNSYSQTGFEEGYYIDNAGNRNDVLIKNVNWKSNPVDFKYKTTEDAEVKARGINTVREFGINNISKYTRARVDIDRSAENLSDISASKEPDFREEELFLQVIVEGKATLYQYVDGNLSRFFFSKEGSEIEQLVYKSYLVSGTKTAKNSKFRQQLWDNLQCPSFEMSRFERIDYTRGDLVKLFREYHDCHNSDITFEPERSRVQFNLNLRPRLNRSSLTIENPDMLKLKADFEDQTNFAFGVEAEFTLPYNRKKWSIFIEPTYRYFKQTGIDDQSAVLERNLIFEIDYQSVEVPVGFRHYLILSEKSKLFVNAALVLDFVVDSSLEYSRRDNSNLKHLNIQSQSNLAIGFGYKYNDKYSLEIRYFTSRDILGEYSSWRTDYQSASVIFGYTLF